MIIYFSIPPSHLQAPPAHNFRASSPLREADEMGSELGDDLWDAASLDYPGRDSPNGGGGDMMRSGGVGHPHHGDGWEFMNQVFWRQKTTL